MTTDISEVPVETLINTVKTYDTEYTSEATVNCLRTTHAYQQILRGLPVDVEALSWTQTWKFRRTLGLLDKISMAVPPQATEGYELISGARGAMGRLVDAANRYGKGYVKILLRDKQHRMMISGNAGTQVGDAA